MTKGRERSTSNDAPHAARSSIEGEMNERNDQSGVYADAARLMTQPLAGAAVLSAIGIGMATQAFGLWLTAVSSAMQGAPRGADAQPNTSPAREPAREPAAKTKPAADATVVKFVSKAERASTPKAPKRKASAAPAPATNPKTTKAVDDLKAIAGVGPKLERVLNQLGITTYAHVAALGQKEIASLEDQLGFKGRITRDDWIGQAKALIAGGKA